MDHLGDFSEDATVQLFFTTHDSAGGAVAPSTAFEADDVLIYKDGSATQKTTTNGLTMTSPFDAITGLHHVSIDTSIDTGDAGFWTTGSDYTVVLSPTDETVDGETVVRVLAQFSIQNRYMRGTDNAALASVLGALNDAAAAGDPTAADTVMQYLKQLINTLEGSAGIPSFPAEAGPANDVSLAEVIRAIHADVTGLNGDAMRGTDGANTTIPPTAIENADELLTRDWNSVSGEASRSTLNALRLLRNRYTIVSTTLTVMEEDDATSAWTATLTTDANADPITASDPS